MILQECLQVFHPLSFFFKYVQSYQHNYSLKITRRTNKSANVVGKIRIHNKSMFNGQIQSNILLPGTIIELPHKHHMMWLS